MIGGLVLELSGGRKGGENEGAGDEGLVGRGGREDGREVGAEVGKAGACPDAEAP